MDQWFYWQGEGSRVHTCSLPQEMYDFRRGTTKTEYYKSPDESAQAFTKDGWLKSGNLMYRDEQDNYFYVSRIKTLIKYQGFYRVIPGELEEVIHSHPAVADVVVIGVPHPIDGERPVACVVKKQGCDVTEHEIKDLVVEKLSEKIQLYGDVLFLKELPLLSTGKVDLKELKRITESLINK